MTVFLTSSPTGEDRTALLDCNGWIGALSARWKPRARCLLVSSDPANIAMGEEMRDGLRAAFANSGLTVSAFHIWDGRTEEFSPQALGSYDVVVLGGGHVPTQNAFFQRIRLRETLEALGPQSDCIVIGVSAGTMNSAETVYAQPELPGESIDPAYRRFLPGLGLTRVNILPHYQKVKNELLDGKRLFEDITYPDSVGREFFALVDGSYLLSERGAETIFGEAYRIAEGKLELFCQEGQPRQLPRLQK